MGLQERKDKGLELYKQGMSLSQISKEVGINRLTITNYVKSKGFSVSNPARKHRYNDNYFEEINTEDKAYWLGFIYADGSINDRGKSKTLEITLKESDKDHLIKFATAIGGVSDLVNEKVVKLNGKEILTYKVVISCTKMCNDLIKHGATPKKSLTLSFPTHLDNTLIRHFLRGYFDGDGCIQSSRDRITLLGTEGFLKKVQYYFSLYGVSPTKISNSHHGKAYGFEKSGKELVPLLSVLYLNANTYLDRKFKLAYAVLRGNSLND